MADLMNVASRMPRREAIKQLKAEIKANHARVVLSTKVLRGDGGRFFALVKEKKGKSTEEIVLALLILQRTLSTALSSLGLTPAAPSSGLTAVRGSCGDPNCPTCSTAAQALPKKLVN